MQRLPLQPKPYIIDANLNSKSVNNVSTAFTGKENRRYADSQIKFPVTKAILWNREPVDVPNVVEFLPKRQLHVTVSERALQLAFHHSHHVISTTSHSFLIGSLNAEEEGHMSLQLDRYDPGRETEINIGGNVVKRRVPTTIVPGDLAVPLKVYIGLRQEGDAPLMSPDDFKQAFKYLKSRVRSQESVNLSHLFVTKACCYFQSDVNEVVTDFTCNVVYYKTAFRMTPIKSVPIIPTALARNLSGPMRLSTVQEQAKFGYLTMDHTRKLLLVLESDPKAKTLPLVGVWISGIERIKCPFVWACLIKFINCEVLQERVLAPPNNFLLACYMQDHSQPTFYECSQEEIKNPAEDYDVLECHDEFFLQPQSHDKTHEEITFMMKKTTDGASYCNFMEAAGFPNDHGSTSDKNNIREKEGNSFVENTPRARRYPAKKVINVDDTEAFPSPVPSPKPHPQSKQPIPAKPAVPELSFIESETPRKAYNPAVYQQESAVFDQSFSDTGVEHESRKEQATGPSDVVIKVAANTSKASEMEQMEHTKETVICGPSTPDVVNKSLSMDSGQTLQNNTPVEPRSPFELIADQQKQLLELQEQVLQLLKEREALEKESPIQKEMETANKHINKVKINTPIENKTTLQRPPLVESAGTNTGESLFSPNVVSKAPERVSLGTNTGQSLFVVCSPTESASVDKATSRNSVGTHNSFDGGTNRRSSRGSDNVADERSICRCRCSHSNVDRSVEQQTPVVSAGRPSHGTTPKITEQSADGPDSSFLADSPASTTSRLFRSIQDSKIDQSMDDTIKSALTAVDVPEYDSTMSPEKEAFKDTRRTSTGEGQNVSRDESASMCAANDTQAHPLEWSMHDDRSSVLSTPNSPRSLQSENLPEDFYDTMMEQVRELLEGQAVSDEATGSGEERDSQQNSRSSSSEESSDTQESDQGIFDATVKELERITGTCLREEGRSDAGDVPMPLHPRIQYQSLLVNQSLDATQYHEFQNADAIALKYLSRKEVHELRKQNYSESTKTVKFQGVFEKTVPSQWKTSVISVNVSCNMSIATKQYLKKYNLLDLDKNNSPKAKEKKCKKNNANETQTVLDIPKLKKLPKLV